jgi:diguanylate cyclase (GGDEF)-like protein
LLEVALVNWSELPDFTAVALLSCAFASVTRRNRTPESGLWLTAWIMIVCHFGAFMFDNLPGIWGTLATLAGLVSLVWAGILFMWASVPYRQQVSSRWILVAMLFSNTLYIVLISTVPRSWALIYAAALFAALPLAIAIIALRKFNHPLRWVLVCLYTGLSIFLLSVQNRPGSGPDLALNGVLFTVYFGCCVHFWWLYRRATAGAFITIAGFLAWANVFTIAPCMAAFWPQAHLENEVWNLPKYVVAVGMILLLLEDQIAHNRHLALHDPLTGLPNRRLFQDRLASALERARRTETQAALLVIDLDRFKQVNDTLGHHVGDLLLQRVGSLFGGRVRRSDTVARTGGDEFSVILEEPTSRGEAFHVGESLLQLLHEPIDLGDHTVRIGASVGVAVFPEDAPTMEQLCIAADLKMYDCKHGVGNLGEHGAHVGSGKVGALALQTESN